MHRSWLRAEGLPDDTFEGRPVIGIANSWSELTPCNLHQRELAEHVKRGVWQAGGVPFEFPTTSAGEPLAANCCTSSIRMCRCILTRFSITMSAGHGDNSKAAIISDM